MPRFTRNSRSPVPRNQKNGENRKEKEITRVKRPHQVLLETGVCPRALGVGSGEMVHLASPIWSDG